MIRKRTSIKFLLAGSIAGIAITVMMSPTSEGLARPETQMEILSARQTLATETPTYLASANGIGPISMPGDDGVDALFAESDATTLASLFGSEYATQPAPVSSPDSMLDAPDAVPPESDPLDAAVGEEIFPLDAEVPGNISEDDPAAEDAAVGSKADNATAKAPTPPAKPAAPVLVTKTLKLRSGDSLAKILDRAGIGRKDAYRITRAIDRVLDLYRLFPGQEVDFTFKPASEKGKKHGELVELSIEHTPGVHAVVTPTDDDFTATERRDPLTSVTVDAEGSITGSFRASALKQGVPRSVIYDFVTIFSGTVDFRRDLRKGDSFRIVYEKSTTPDGRTVDQGGILFASMTTRGERLTVYRHVDATGYEDYYDGTGRSLQKTLMRRPVGSARISSPYGLRRHPVLGYKKMHWGVDFAARRGTPIKAAGDGIIERRGRYGAYGKYIRLRHNGTWKSAYAHMNGYARGLRAGSRVKQGQIIGYVGNTGRSTGPHLHFELIKRGKRVNPMRVKIASAGRKLKGKELKRFAQTRGKFDKTYAAMGSISIARLAGVRPTPPKN